MAGRRHLGPGRATAHSTSSARSAFNATKRRQDSLISGAELQGTAPMWAWIGDEAATTFSY